MKFKKLSINFLCALIIIILGCSVLMSLYSLGYSFGSGFRAGIDDKNEDISQAQMLDVYFDPSTEQYLSPTDTIAFTNGVKLPVTYTRGIVYSSHPADKGTDWLTIMQILCYAAEGICFIMIVILFVQFIININKGKIFVAENVKLLRKIALWLIALALIIFCSGICQELAVSKMGLTLEDYNISAYWTMPWDILIIGLVALLMAQAWSRGIQLKEDQELTI